MSTLAVSVQRRRVIRVLSEYFICPVRCVNRSITVVLEYLPEFIRIMSMVQLRTFNGLFILGFITVNRSFSVKSLKSTLFFWANDCAPTNIKNCLRTVSCRSSVFVRRVQEKCSRSMYALCSKFQTRNDKKLRADHVR